MPNITKTDHSCLFELNLLWVLLATDLPHYEIRLKLNILGFAYSILALTALENVKSNLNERESSVVIKFCFLM